MNMTHLFWTKQNILSAFSQNTSHSDYIPQLGSSSCLGLVFLKIKV